MPILAQEIEVVIEPEAPGSTRLPRLGIIRMHLGAAIYRVDAVSPNRHQITGGTKPDTCTSPAC